MTQGLANWILKHKATGFTGVMIVADQKQSDLNKGLLTVVSDNGIPFRAPVGSFELVKAL